MVPSVVAAFTPFALPSCPVTATTFALVAIGGLIFGLAALHNFLPLGTQSSLLSAGMLPLLNLAVGIEVAGAVTLIISEFVDQTLLRSRR